MFLKANVRISKKPGALHAVISVGNGVSRGGGRSTSVNSNLNVSVANRSIRSSSINRDGSLFGRGRKSNFIASQNFIPAYRVPTSPNVTRDRN